MAIIEKVPRNLMKKTFRVSRREEQDGGGVAGCGVHLSTRIHQEHTFRHRSPCRTPAESGQEDLTSGKECVDPRKTGSDEGTRGKIGVLIELALLSAEQGSDPHVRATV